MSYKQNRKKPELTKQEKKAQKREKKAQKREKKNKGNKLKNVNNVNKPGFIQQGFNAVNNFIGGIDEPTDGVDNNLLNIVVYNQSFLNNIATKCLPVAGGAEFQVHYRALQVVVSKGIHRIIYTFPTVFFNFTQTVSTGSVDYNLVEVDQISGTHKKESNEMCQKIAGDFPTSFFTERGFEVKFREDEIGSIHRHPGDFSFSTIDKDKNPRNPGVIYRRGSANDLIQTDSVIYIPGVAADPKVKIVTTQTRVVNVELQDNQGIKGTYDKAQTITMIVKDSDSIPENIVTKITKFDAFFSETETEVVTEEVAKQLDIANNFIRRYHNIEDGSAELYIENLAKILQIVISSGYKPVDKVNKDLIKTRVSYGGNYYGGNYYGGHKARFTTPKADFKDFPLEDICKELQLDLKTLKADQLSDEELITIFWNSGGDNTHTKTELKVQNGTVTIEKISDFSTVFKVTTKIKLGTGVKNTFTKYKNRGSSDDYIILDKPKTAVIDNLNTYDMYDIGDPDNVLDIEEISLENLSKVEIDNIVQLKLLFTKCYNEDYNTVNIANQFMIDGLKLMLDMMNESDFKTSDFKLIDGDLKIIAEDKLPDGSVRISLDDTGVYESRFVELDI